MRQPYHKVLQPTAPGEFEPIEESAVVAAVFLRNTGAGDIIVRRVGGGAETELTLAEGQSIEYRQAVDLSQIEASIPIGSKLEVHA